MNFSARTTALVTLALAGCVPSIVVGDQPQDDAGLESTTDASLEPTSEPTLPDATSEPTSTGAASEPASTASTGEPEPGVCGDGVVNAGEACDDGNDEPNDGCDADCSVTGEVLWKVDGPGSISDLVVAPDGTILASGWDVEAFLTAFAPDGSELWSRQTPSAGEMAVDAAGRIFVISSLTGVHAYAADGADLWSMDPNPGGDFAASGLDVDSQKVYIGVYEGSDQLVVRGLDIGSGEVVWEALSPADETLWAEDLTVLGDKIYAVGRIAAEDETLRAGAAVFTTSGEVLPFELADPAIPLWAGAAVSGDGELVLVGQGLDEPGFILRRVGADLDELWTWGPTGAFETPESIATGPDARIAVVGGDNTAENGAVIRLHAATGDLLWASSFASPGDTNLNTAVGVGFGPDFVAVAGNDWTGPDEEPVVHWWIRRFALD